MSQHMLLTGATGFMGQHLHQVLKEHDVQVRCALRRSDDRLPNSIVVGEIDGTTNWDDALKDVDTVIHLAGRAHVLTESITDPLSEFRRVNRDGTRHLAQQMIANGCRRLIFISSIGLHGDTAPSDRPLTASSPINPQLDYAVAKLEAEQALAQLKNDLEIVIVRPPLVYGANAPGNFARLVRFIKKGTPLPLGAANALRSYVSLQNLCDFLYQCAINPAAAGETFLVSDGEDLSTADLLRRVGHALGQPVRLIPVPAMLLRVPLGLLGRQRLYDQLFTARVIDNMHACQILNWQPPLTVNEALQKLN